MKFFVSKNDLNLATSRCQGAITDKTLSQISLRALPDQLEMAVADRMIAIYCSVPCRLNGESFIAHVPAKLFSDVVRELPEGEVSVAKEGAFLTIKAANSFMMKIPLLEDRAWREAPVLTEENITELPAAKVVYLIDQIQFCIAHESTRNYGAVGFLHRPENNKLRLVGSDGFRLSYAELEMALPDNFLSNGVCITKRGLSEMARMCSEGFEKIKISIAEDGTTLAASVPHYQIFIRLAAVKYPTYERVLPKAKLVPVKISRNHVQSVARRVLIAADKTKALQLQFAERSLTLSSRTVGSSEGKESIELDDYAGGDKELALNGKFLADVFSNIPAEEIIFSFKSEDDPVTLVPLKEPDNCHSMHVLVPIKESE